MSLSSDTGHKRDEFFVVSAMFPKGSLPRRRVAACRGTGQLKPWYFREAKTGRGPGARREPCPLRGQEAVLCHGRSILFWGFAGMLQGFGSSCTFKLAKMLNR